MSSCGGDCSCTCAASSGASGAGFLRRGWRGLGLECPLAMFWVAPSPGGCGVAWAAASAVAEFIAMPPPSPGVNLWWGPAWALALVQTRVAGQASKSSGTFTFRLWRGTTVGGPPLSSLSDMSIRARVRRWFPFVRLLAPAGAVVFLWAAGRARCVGG